VTAKHDIYRAVKLIIEQHGAGAADFAVKRAERLFDDGDPGGTAVWWLILNAIVDLQKPPHDDEARALELAQQAEALERRTVAAAPSTSDSEHSRTSGTATTPCLAKP
jgi:hypothetical protein